MRRRPLLGLAFGTVLAGTGGSAAAQSIALAGRMGAKALLVIDGQPRTLAVGESALGVRLLAIDGDQVRVERNGVASTLRVGGAPVAVGEGAPRGPGAREIVIPVGPGGHFVADGAINGQATRFMVDTGATLVALSQAEAARFNIDLRNARRGVSSTANGTVPIMVVTLNSVRVGGVEVFNVPAAVMPAQMPMVLLGNSFLGRFSMRRDSDVMRLEYKP